MCCTELIAINFCLDLWENPSHIFHCSNIDKISIFHHEVYSFLDIKKKFCTVSVYLGLTGTDNTAEDVVVRQMSVKMVRKYLGMVRDTLYSNSLSEEDILSKWWSKEYP